MTVDLSTLPPPRVVEEVDNEVLLEGKIARLNANFLAAGLPYSASALVYDPAVIQLQGAAYDEGRLRVRINDAVRRTLLFYAKGSDLDHLGGAHGVARMVGEDDTRYAQRIVLKNMDRNSAGTEPRYHFLAMTAHLRVKDAVVYTVGRDPTIYVAILATDNDGVANEPLLAAVDAVLQAPANRMVNDRVVVEPVVRDVVNVAADVWLLPDAPASTLVTAEAALRAAWTTEARIGRDLSPSWLYRHLSVPGVQRIEALLPATNVAVPFNRMAAIGMVELSMAGRAF